ncbi:MAG: DUF4331 family protein [Flavobacteriaceae bacterium]|nr:DUF4331 family protein [Flavobacteriaceae bacterium]
MKLIYIKPILFSLLISVLTFNCSNDDDGAVPRDNEPDFTGNFVQQDQMARPAINTVFVSSGDKDAFNTTVPSQQGAAFQSMFQTKLEALSPAFNEPGDTNLLGFTSEEFTTALATDVLNVSLDGTTTFFDGTNVLTGRALADDVITVELILIFGGEDGSENPSLSDDNVDANDKAFLTSFPYLAPPF